MKISIRSNSIVNAMEWVLHRIPIDLSPANISLHRSFHWFEWTINYWQRKNWKIFAGHSSLLWLMIFHFKRMIIYSSYLITKRIERIPPVWIWICTRRVKLLFDVYLSFLLLFAFITMVIEKLDSMKNIAPVIMSNQFIT